jgi:hypothetical protein
MSHLQVSAVNIKANFAIELNQTSVQQPQESPICSSVTAEPAVIDVPSRAELIEASTMPKPCHSDLVMV